MSFRFGIAAFTLGGAAMYLIDPDRGRRRRALMRDKLRHSTHQVERAITVTSSDLQNRAKGVRAAVEHLFTGETPDDQILVARVRSKIGRVVSHPSSLEVSVDNGVVTLRGDLVTRHRNVPTTSSQRSDDLIATLRDLAETMHDFGQLFRSRCAPLAIRCETSDNVSATSNQCWSASVCWALAIGARRASWSSVSIHRCTEGSERLWRMAGHSPSTTVRA